MDFIKQWTLTVSTTLIISILFSILSPKGNMGRFFKVILAMFIFVSFIYPIKNADIQFELPAFDEIEYQDTQGDVYEKIICQNIESTLNDGGYLSSKVSADVKYAGEEIEVKSLEVGIMDEFNKDEVKRYLLDSTGFNAEVYYLGE